MSLTGARGVASMLVFIGHTRVDISNIIDISIIMHFLDAGGVWVDFFFILSGFILAYVYGGNFLNFGFRVTLKKFALARFARIWPLHATVLLMIVGLGMAKWALVSLYGIEASSSAFYGRTPEGFLANIFLIHVLNPAWAWNPPSWSISTEMFAYLMFPLLYLWRVKQGQYVVVLATVFLGLYWMAGAFPSDLQFSGVRLLFNGIIEFVLGVCAFQFRGLLSQLTRGQAGALQLLFLSCSIVMIEVDAPMIFVAASFALLITACFEDHGVVAEIFKSKPIHFLGRISFSIYMTHWLVIQISDMTFNFLGPKIASDFLLGMLPWAKVVFIYAGVFVLSSLTYTWIEVKARKSLINYFTMKAGKRKSCV
jgi:peptidoglycan/LPS O-acetylase OafA/YrhL